MYSTRDVVLTVLAYRCNCAPSALTAQVRLDDLHLRPLDLVLVIAEVEEFEGADIPLERLDELETVGELVTRCVRAVRESRTRQDLRKVS